MYFFFFVNNIYIFIFITITMPMSYKAIFNSSKNVIFLTKFCDIFLNIASIIDCGWSLKPPCRAVLTKYLQSMFWRTKKIIYSRTSMARTSLGPWQFARNMDSSSHWGLIMAQVQEANSDNLGKSLWFSTQWDNESQLYIYIYIYIYIYSWLSLSRILEYIYT